MNQRLRFEEPRLEVQDSFRRLVREFVERGEPLIPFPLSFDHSDFAAFVRRLSACARGDGIPDGFVPHSTYWLVRDGTEVVGVSNLRHRLTDALRHTGGNIGYGVRPSARRQGVATQLLGCTLDRARDMGMNEALLTCSKTNEASIRTILRNGGAFVSEDYIPSEGAVMQRYRIALGRDRPVIPSSR